MRNPADPAVQGCAHPVDGYPGVGSGAHTGTQAFGDIDPGIGLIAGQHNGYRLPGGRTLADLEEPTVEYAVDRGHEVVTLDVQRRTVALCLRLPQRLFRLREFLDGRAREKFLELCFPQLEAGLRGVELCPCAITILRGCEFFLQEFFGALKLCAPELDIAFGAGQVGSGLGDLLLPRAAYQLIEPCLGLPDGSLGLAQARAGPRIVLAQDELSRRYRFPFSNEDLEYRFVHLCDEFDTVGCQFADDNVEIVRVVARRQRHCRKAGDDEVSWMHPFAPLMP